MPTKSMDTEFDVYAADESGNQFKLSGLNDLNLTTAPEVIEGTDGENTYVFEGSGDKELVRILMDAIGIREIKE